MGSLEQKVNTALEQLESVRREYEHSRIRVAWTGGKDSTVALHLWRRTLERAGGEAGLLVLNIDTGVKFTEVLSFRDSLVEEWDISLEIVRPPEAVRPQTKDFVPSDRVACCRDLKVDPLNRAVKSFGVSALISGVRRDEHPSRASRVWREERLQPDYVMFNPVLEFTEMDIWAYIMEQGLPYCELYDQGYRSLGCVPCTRLADGGDERAGRDGEKEKRLGLLTSMGYF